MDGVRAGRPVRLAVRTMLPIRWPGDLISTG